MKDFNGFSRQDLLLLACSEKRRIVGGWLFNQLVFQTATKEEIEKKFNEMVSIGKIINTLKQQKQRALTLEAFNEKTGKIFSEKRFFETSGFKKAVSKDGKEYAYFCGKCGWVLGHPRQECLTSSTMQATNYHCNLCNSIIGINIFFKFPI